MDNPTERIKKKKGFLMVLAFFVFLIGSGYFFWSRKGATSISIIGGADGPTSIFLAGRINNNDLFVTVIIIVVAALFFYSVRWISKYKKENTQHKK